MSGPVPDLLRFQPEPLTTHVARLTFADGVATAITRTWAPGDHQRCRLCPVSGCVVKNNACLKLVDRPVSEEDAPLLDTTSFTRVRRPSIDASESR